MGRGLSDLQRDILHRARHNRAAAPERVRQTFEAEMRRWEEDRPWYVENGFGVPERPVPGDPAFLPDVTPAEVVAALDPARDSPRRRSIQATVARALARLVRRGLLRPRWRVGLQLTDEGLALATSLSVNTALPADDVNR